MIRFLAVAAMCSAVVIDAHAQRRGGGTATLAIFVTDASGAPVTNVLVSAQGPATSQTRTEQGRAVFENVPPGTYRLRFERDQFITLEREVIARGGAPIDVKVTLARAPAPEPPPRVEAPVPVPVLPTVNAEPVTIDLSAFIEKNYVGRAPAKISSIACGAGGTAVLMQLREPVDEHVHGDADEFLYVIAGMGTARIAGKDQPLEAGVFTLVPRAVPHTLTVRGRTPLVVLSIKAGERCTPAPASR
jgi:mannose-6-phosphate isomerase-like protein (cupin superfamily)